MLTDSEAAHVLVALIAITFAYVGQCKQPIPPPPAPPPKAEAIEVRLEMARVVEVSDTTATVRYRGYLIEQPLGLYPDATVGELVEVGWSLRAEAVGLMRKGEKP